MSSATSLIFDLLGRDVSASATVKKFGAEVEATSGGASAAFSKAATGITVAAAAAVAESIRMAGTFQSQMTRLVTAAGESQSNLAAVSAGVLQVSADTGVTTTNLASGMYQIESAGFHGANGLNVLKAAAQGAQIEGADVTTVANALTTALDDMHKPASDAALVMSQMVAAVGQGKMTMDDLAGSLHSVLPNATALGLSFPQVAGALAEMTSQGMSADQAAQNLNHTIVSLAAPTATMTSAMASYGLSSAQVAKDLGTNGLTGTMQDVSNAILTHMGPAGTTLINSMNQSKAAANDLQVMMKSMPASMSTLAASFLAGNTSFSTFRSTVRATGGVTEAQGTQFLALAQKAQGFNAQLSSGSNAAQTYTAAMKGILGDQTNLQVGLHLTGAAAAGFNAKVVAIGAASTDASGNVNDWTTKQKTLNIQIAELTANVKVAMIEIGTKLVPAVSDSVQWITKHISVVGKAALGLIALAVAVKLVQGVIATAKAIIAVFNGIMAVGTGIVNAYKGAQLGMAAATRGTTVLTEEQTLMMERSKIAQIASTIATKAMAAGTWLLNTAMDANPFVLVGIAIVALGVALYEAYEHSATFRKIVKAAFDDVKVAGLALWNDGIKPAMAGIEDAWNSVWSAVSDAWQTVGKPVFDVIVDVVKVWYTVQKDTFIAVLIAIGLLFYAFRSVWNGIGKPIFDLMVTVAKSWWQANVVVFNAVVAAFRSVWSAAQAVWTAVGVPVFNAIKAVIADVWNVMQAGWNDVALPVWNAMQATWSFLWGGMQTLWNTIGKPVFAAIQTATSGVGAGLKWAYDNVILPTWNLLSSAWSGIKAGWDNLLSDMGKISGGVLGGIKSAINEVIDLINDMIRALDGINMTLPSVNIPGVGKVGGETIGLHVPQIPRLSAGATIKASTGGTLALLGEGGKDESVVDTGLINGVLASVLNDSQQRQSHHGAFAQGSTTIVQLNMPLMYGNADTAAREILNALQRLKGSGVQTALG